MTKTFELTESNIESLAKLLEIPKNHLVQILEKLQEIQEVRERSRIFDDEHYKQWNEKIDDLVHRMIDDYTKRFTSSDKGISDKGINECYKELSRRLSKLETINYDQVEMPIAYGLKYLPRKIMAFTATLSKYFSREDSLMPKRILDIGSGTDAVTIALGLFTKSELEITAIEPAYHMRSFLGSSFLQEHFLSLNLDHKEGKFDSKSLGELQEEYYDLIVMSSILQKSFKEERDSWWLQNAESLYRVGENNARLILIEPKAKKSQLDIMKKAMEESGWTLIDEFNLNNLLPCVEEKKYTLPKLTSLKKKMNITDTNLKGFLKRYPVESWNTEYERPRITRKEPYDEIIHIYGKSNNIYTQLETLLKAKNFREADEETERVILAVANRQSEGWLRIEDAENFPCKELRTIDNLWLKYSQGKFGISVQQEIYKNLGGTKQYNDKVWISFGDRIGWRSGGSWLYYDDLNFSLSAPTGQLPCWRCCWGGVGVRWFWWLFVASLLSRHVECNP